jgi:hypothetical protein
MSTFFLTDAATTSVAVEDNRTNHKLVDVAVYFDQFFFDTFYRPRTSRQIASALDYAVQSIPAPDETLAVDVSFPAYRVEWDEVDSISPDDDWHREQYNTDALFSEWKRQLDEDVPAGTRAVDSNILITAHLLDGFTGKGQVPASCAEAAVADASIVEMPYEGFDEDAVRGPRNPHDPSGTLSTIVHEFGHTIGLRHDMGTAELRGGECSVSPMVSRYASDKTFMGSKNSYGQQLPEAVSGQFTIRPQFNPEIPLADVHAATPCRG